MLQVQCALCHAMPCHATVGTLCTVLPLVPTSGTLCTVLPLVPTSGDRGTVERAACTNTGVVSGPTSFDHQLISARTASATSESESEREGRELLSTNERRYRAPLIAPSAPGMPECFACCDTYRSAGGYTVAGTWKFSRRARVSLVPTKYQLGNQLCFSVAISVTVCWYSTTATSAY